LPEAVLFSVIGLAIILFATTNVDDIFVLLTFLSERGVRTGHVIVGQYLGITALLLISIVGSLVSLLLAPDHIGFLGLLPLLIGLKKVLDLRRRPQTSKLEKTAGVGTVLAVAGVTIANGGDNIAAYVPVFATRSAIDITVIAIVFVALVAVWITFAHWLVNHPTFGAPIRRYGHFVTPLVLIILGVLIMREAGSLRLLFG
jgi:cadmium resistance protein CadD (predicted permease)